MTLGCGALGGNITSDNMTPLHLVDVKRLAYEMRQVEPGAAVPGWPVGKGRATADATPGAAPAMKTTTAAIPPAAAGGTATADGRVERIVREFLAGRAPARDGSTGGGRGAGPAMASPGRIAHAAPATSPAPPPAMSPPAPQVMPPSAPQVMPPASPQAMPPASPQAMPPASPVVRFVDVLPDSGPVDFVCEDDVRRAIGAKATIRIGCADDRDPGRGGPRPGERRLPAGGITPRRRWRGPVAKRLHFSRLKKVLRSRPRRQPLRPFGRRCEGRSTVRRADTLFRIAAGRAPGWLLVAPALVLAGCAGQMAGAPGGAVHGSGPETHGAAPGDAATATTTGEHRAAPTTPPGRPAIGERSRELEAIQAPRPSSRSRSSRRVIPMPPSSCAMPSSRMRCACRAATGTRPGSTSAPWGGSRRRGSSSTTPSTCSRAGAWDGASTRRRWSSRSPPRSRLRGGVGCGEGAAGPDRRGARPGAGRRGARGPAPR